MQKRIRNHVAVYLTEKDRERLKAFAEKKDLSISSAARLLIRDQLRWVDYDEWRRKGGKPNRKKRRA